MTEHIAGQQEAQRYRLAEVEEGKKIQYWYDEQLVVFPGVDREYMAVEQLLWVAA